MARKNIWQKSLNTSVKYWAKFDTKYNTAQYTEEYLKQLTSGEIDIRKFTDRPNISNKKSIVF